MKLDRVCRLLTGLILGIASLVATQAHAAGNDASITRQPAYISSTQCSACHADIAEAWRGSDHSWAWREPTSDNVLGEFDGTMFEHRGVVSRFTKRGGKFFVETDGPDGLSSVFEVVGTVGVEPLQQYLVETEPGRLQALDLAWDTERNQWFHLYPDQDLKAGNGLHWTGPYKNWNARCAECHATGYRKNYDPRSKTYASDQAEIGVGCEACHGPGEAHAAWAGDAGSFEASQWQGIDGIGLTFAFDPADPEAEIQQCAGCHARREPLGDASPAVGTPFADSYRLAVLRDGLYHPDGQILDEVYVYGSFLQSKMHARGVRCSNCHEPHSGELKGPGNAVCTQCHNPEGNREFPTLKRATYDDPEHHFHGTGTPAAQCVNCHMPERLYMVVDGRRDHSFRIPRSDLSAEIAVPNACTDCHVDRKADWAAEQVKVWYPNGRSGEPHYGQVIARARRDMGSAVQDQLIALALDTDQPGIVRATALHLMASAPTAWAADRTAILLEDSDPTVRSAAIRVQSAASPPVRTQRIVPGLSDRMRSVRIQAARNLLDVPVARYPPAIAKSLRAAMGEYQSSLMAKADFPEVQMAIAGTALALRNLPAAEQGFGEAVRMDPQHVDAWMMVTRLQVQRGALDEARATLEQAVAANPFDGVLHQSLGNLLVMAGKNSEAVVPLEKAARLMPNDATVAADLGILLSNLRKHGRAVDVLHGVAGSMAETADTLYALIVSLAALGDMTAAEPIVRKIEADYPASPLGRQARQLVSGR